MPKILNKDELLYKMRMGETIFKGNEVPYYSDTFDHSPIIQMPDGKWAVFSWKELIEIAMKKWGSE